MAEVKTEEPSIEEILESIRQIISEDVDGGAKPAATVLSAAIVQPPPPSPPLKSQAAAAPPPQPAPVPLDLTEKVTSSSSFLDLSQQVPPPMTVTIEMMDSPMTDEIDALMSAQTAETVTDSLSKLLMSNIAIEKEDTGRPGKVTLEEMARELMRPLIKVWLDQNLPAIIERLVQKEVEKLSRRAMDR